VIIRKSWRSEWFILLLFLITSIASVQLSHVLPWSVIKGDIWNEVSLQVYLHLPLFWLVPAFFLGLAFVRVHDVQFHILEHILEAHYGIVSLHRKVVRIRYEDIRSVEVIQSVFERVLKIGIIEISTSATGGVEIIMEGVSQPHFIQEMLLSTKNRN
jgi:uncharacterized membrane protein YdbT with pleckstrin-like domain